jgi:hypothetical protein
MPFEALVMNKDTEGRLSIIRRAFRRQVNSHYVKAPIDRPNVQSKALL